MPMEFSVKSARKILDDISYEELRCNSVKDKREVWCVGNLCKTLSMDEVRIIPAIRQSDSADITIVSKNDEFKIQVTEIAPKDSEVLKIFQQFIPQNDTSTAKPFSELKSEVSAAINASIKLKEKKHYSDAEEINLLIYLNGPHGLLFDVNRDLDLDKLKEDCKCSVFASIIVFIDQAEGVSVFLKNNRLVGK